MTWNWVRTLGIGLALATLCQAGCLWIAAGAAGSAAVGYAYVKGNVCGAYHAQFEDAWKSTHTSLVEMSLPILKEERDRATGFIETRAPGGDRIRINLDLIDDPIPGEPPLTRVCVRVATFGDQPLSERILDQVGGHLVPAAGAPAVAASPPPPGTILGPPVGPVQSSEPPLLRPAPSGPSK